MNERRLRAFVRERDAALLSLDKARIVTYLRKYGGHVPQDDWVFWAAVHKAITALNSATPVQKQRSREWLRAHGSVPLD